jgi:hypothetical protein
MPTTTTVSSNYAGRAAGEIIGQAFKAADAIQKGLITVAEDVPFKLNLRKIQYTNGTTAYTCGFAPAGAVTLNEKELEPKKFKNDFDVCKEDFRSTWSTEIMGASAANPNAPADIMEAIQVEVLAAMAEKLGRDIWQGDDTNTDEFDGLIKQFVADSDVKKPTADAAVTETNVLAKYLKAALNDVPVALRSRDLTFAVSPDVFQAYMFYLNTQGIVYGNGNQDFAVTFGRHTITEDAGLTDNTVVIFEKKNVIFATGLLSDHNTVALSDEDEVGLLTGKVRGKVVYSAAVGYYNGEEIVYLTLED